MTEPPPTTLRPTTTAMGGINAVPVPDDLARAYLLLALRLDQHLPGLVDGYFGPADLKAQVDLEAVPAPARLRDDAVGLATQVRDAADLDPARRAWLTVQLTALVAQAGVLAGDRPAYLDLVARLFDRRPLRRDEAVFEAAAAEIASILPTGPATGAPLADRLAAWDAPFEIPPDRLPPVVDRLVDRLRGETAARFGLPEGEALRVGYVRGQPWTGYCWYDGGYRSRIDLNRDLPIRVWDLIGTIAHETYPGHHTEHAWKERELVQGHGWLEGSVLLINTPECLISEGLAELGRRFAAPPVAAAELLAEVCQWAELPLADEPVALREAAERSVALAGPRRRLAEARVNAAILRHLDGADGEAVLDYLVEVGRLERSVAAKRLEFIDHPLWRTYVFVYHDGEALLARWLDAVPEAERAARFGRLLREPLTPSAIAAELGPGGQPQPG